MTCVNHVRSDEHSVWPILRTAARALASVLLVAGIVVTPRAQGAYKEISFGTLSDWSYNPKEPWEVSPHKVANTIPA